MTHAKRKVALRLVNTIEAMPPRGYFGELVKKEREVRGISQRQLSERLGFSGGMIAKLESGFSKGLRVESFAALVKHFGWDANQILRDYFLGAGASRGQMSLRSLNVTKPVAELVDLARSLDEDQLALLTAAAGAWLKLKSAGTGSNVGRLER